MASIEIQPITSPIRATFRMPASKSYMNRALVMAIMSKTPVQLHNPLFCEDTETMINCLRTLGISITQSMSKIFVLSHISQVENKTYDLFLRDSGTCARFLCALMCITPGVQILRGNPRLHERPMKDLIDALRELGAEIECLEKEGFLPIKITSSSFTHNQCTLPGDISSQYISALLMLAPMTKDGLTIDITTHLISKPYIHMTIEMMKHWGILVEEKENGYHVRGQQTYTCHDYFIEGDFSSSCYFFAIAALTNSTLRLENLNPHSKQADLHFVHFLNQRGNQIIEEPNAITIQGNFLSILRLGGLIINMEEMPDQIPTLAILAAFAKGITEIRGIESLRVKESDRVAAIQQELHKMSIKVEADKNTLRIHGGNPRAATIETHNDHRIAMAFAVAAMKISGIKILNTEVVNKTFPKFWDLIKSLH